MTHTRRDIALLLPALIAANAEAAQSAEVLPSACYPFESLPVKNNQNGSVTRQVFTGETHEHFPIDMHITTLPPGVAPHPPHTHVHEEMIMLQSGTLEVTVAGQSSRIGPGSVAYVHTAELHGWENVGNVPATYFVLAIGHQSKT